MKIVFILYICILLGGGDIIHKTGYHQMFTIAFLHIVTKRVSKMVIFQTLITGMYVQDVGIHNFKRLK